MKSQPTAPRQAPRPRPSNELSADGALDVTVSSVGAWLSSLDRRLRRATSLDRTALLLPGAAVALLLARWFGFLLLDSVLASGAALLGLIAVVFVLRYRTAPADHVRAASTVDQHAGLDDLVKTAAALEGSQNADRRPETSASRLTSGPEDLRHGLHRLVIGRARHTLSGLEPRQVEPVRLPRAALVGTALLLLAAVVPLPRPSGASAAGSSLLLSSTEAGAETDPEQDNAPLSAAQAVDEERFSDALEPQMVQEITQLDPRLAALLQAKGLQLDAEALADLANAEGSELSQDTLARLEDLVERFGEELEELEPGGERAQANPPGEFEELSRQGGATPPPREKGGPEGEDGPHAEGDRAAGEGQPQPGSEGAQPGDETSAENVQAIELPPTGDSKLRQAEGQQADMQLQGDGMQVAGEQSGNQEGQQRPGAGGGDSSGPQSGDSQLYGEDLPESQVVTLELTLLKAREEAEERDQRPERRWRASRQETSKVRAERLPEGDWSAPDTSADRELLPRHHRENLRRYFTPTPANRQKQNPESQRP